MIPLLAAEGGGGNFVDLTSSPGTGACCSG